MTLGESGHTAVYLDCTTNSDQSPHLYLLPPLPPPSTTSTNQTSNNLQRYFLPFYTWGPCTRITKLHQPQSTHRKARILSSLLFHVVYAGSTSSGRPCHVGLYPFFLRYSVLWSGCSIMRDKIRTCGMTHEHKRL